MSTTRLLILGAVRIFQPVHGYLVRRELVSWHVDSWAHLNPGSVYNALRKLSRDGLLVEGTTEPGSMGAPRSTTYALTHEGEAEFLALLRGALGRVDEYAADSLMAAIAFMWALPRAEVIAALESRVAQIESQENGLEATLTGVRCDEEMPDHVEEIYRLVFARLHGECHWTKVLIGRLEGGAYAFAGEPQAGHKRPALPGSAGNVAVPPG